MDASRWVDAPSRIIETIAGWECSSAESRAAARSWLVDKLDVFANRPEDCSIHVCRESDIRSAIYVFDNSYNPAVLCYFVTVPKRGSRIHVRAKNT